MTLTVSQHARYQVPETEAAKWNLAIIDFIIYTRAFPIVAAKFVISGTSVAN